MTRPLARLDAAEPLPLRPAIRIRDLRKTFGQLIAIDGVSLDIAPGEFFMIESARADAARPRCCASLPASNPSPPVPSRSKRHIHSAR